MKNPLKYKNIVSAIRELNRSRLEQRRARKLGINSAQRAKGRKKRAPYAHNAGTAQRANTLGQPTVSVVVVGHNGAAHVEALAHSLQRQSYPNIEVIYVDNASNDGSADLIAQLLPKAVIIRNDQNLGFAEGNNIGMDHATGELILLLNNDARLEDHAIERMVSTMVADPEVGAVAPKIRFWEPFVELQINTPAPAGHRIHVKVIESTTGYCKVIDRTGKDSTTSKFLIPASSRQIEVSTLPVDDRQATPRRLPSWNGTLGGQAIQPGGQLPKTDSGNWIINNVGSWVNATGDAGDWGLGETDAGQFDTSCIVDAFCGCCVLIRPCALGLRPLFPPGFFAYYEDTDASERIKGNGFKIVYEPTAVAYHKHASTSVEHSPFFQYFTRRNQSAFQAAHFESIFHAQKEERLVNWTKDGSLSLRSSEFLGANPYSSDKGLLEDALALTAQAINRAIYTRTYPRKRIGIFNEFWTSLGGGELRALHVALALKQHGDVYIISRKPLDLAHVCGHFGLSSDGLKQAVIPDFGEKDTAGLDIFINTAFCSKIFSRAKKSAYLVSFPHIGGDASEMSSYDILLANSIFTQNWCNHYWPSATTELLYPAVDVAPSSDHQTRKENLIVSVGRFFWSGHNKKQSEMLTAFRRLVQMDELKGWRLVLIGGCNTANSSDLAYLNEVKAQAKGLPVDIFVDAPATLVEEYLDKASIYWHATGTGLTDFNPDQFEHFGMAIVEAMSHRAVPVIHGRGGAPEIVQHGQCGYCFDTIDNLVEQTAKLVKLKKSQPSDFEQLGTAARTRSLEFSIDVHNSQLNDLVEKYLR